MRQAHSRLLSRVFAAIESSYSTTSPSTQAAVFSSLVKRSAANPLVQSALQDLPSSALLLQKRHLHPAARHAGDDRAHSHDQIKETIAELIRSEPEVARTLLKDGLNKLSPTCRADVIRSSFINAPGSSVETEPDLVDHLFNTVDENKDNYLNRTEFRNAVAAYAELQEDEKGGIRTTSEASISGRQLLGLALVSGTPFIFFGFMDNAGMLVFGEMVDSTLGVKFGLTAMASAACGNLISDVLGVSLSQMIDNALKKFGLLKDPSLSLKQRGLPVVRRSRLVGAMVGITFGGVLGMVPLLFIEK